MKRRHLLLGAAAAGASAAAVGAGWRVFDRTGTDHRGKPVRLASVGVLNRDDSPRDVAVTVALDGAPLVERTLRADAERVVTATDGLPAEPGRYRVSATLDGETAAVGPGDYRGLDCPGVLVTIEDDGGLGTVFVGPGDSACATTADER